MPRWPEQDGAARSSGSTASWPTGRPATTRRVTFALDFDAPPPAEGEEVAARASTASPRSSRCCSTASSSRESPRCSSHTLWTWARCCAQKQRACDPLPRAEPAAGRAAQAPAPALADAGGGGRRRAALRPHGVLGRAPGFAPGPADRRAVAPGLAGATARRGGRRRRPAPADRRRRRRPGDHGTAARPAILPARSRRRRRDAAPLRVERRRRVARRAAGARPPALVAAHARRRRALHDVALVARRRRARSRSARPASGRSRPARRSTPTAMRSRCRQRRAGLLRAAWSGRRWPRTRSRATLRTRARRGHEPGADPGHRRDRDRRVPRCSATSWACWSGRTSVRQPRLPDRGRRFRARSRPRRARCSRGRRRRPSLAVLCGNSEVEQQAAMFGVDPALGAASCSARCSRAGAGGGRRRALLPSAPDGGVLPFHPGRGVANYFGVGGYRRPLDDARAAGVRFASECLAFANLPDDGVVADGEGVPRDLGADWDFDDVRDHYLKRLFGIDPAAARGRPRALPRPRAPVSGEAMAAVFGEWRRAARRARGGLVLWPRDLWPGAGWGLLDHAGAPKVALAPPAPRARAARVCSSTRGCRGRRARRQRPARAARRRAARRAAGRRRRTRSPRRRRRRVAAHGAAARNARASRSLRRRRLRLPLRPAGPRPRRGDAARRAAPARCSPRPPLPGRPAARAGRRPRPRRHGAGGPTR